MLSEKAASQRAKAILHLLRKHFQMAETVDVLLCMKMSLKTGSHIGECQSSHTTKNVLQELQVVV